MSESDLEPVEHARRRSPALVFSAAVLFLAGIFIGRYVLPAGVDTPTPLKFIAVEEGKRQLIFPTFWEAWDVLHNKFIDIDNVDDADLFYGAVSGLISAAGDPYTTFADPQTTKQFEETIEGSFSGVGIEIGLRQGAVTVIAPLEGSPAQQAGVHEGDIIVAVDGDPVTAETSIDDVVSKIRGRRGTEVVLTVFREGEEGTTDFEITRDTISIESVVVEIQDGIAHVAITSFNGDTAAKFTAASRQLLDQDIRGIIVDVRNNPGGFLQTAVDIASQFIPEGDVIVTERGEEGTEYYAKGNTLLADIPVVVLVNGGSASASEILAGALHDQLGAPLIGTQTFGKGSVQELVKLADGSSLRVTIAKWFTPNGRNIDEEGITPTIEVEQNRDTPEDEVLQRAREELESRL